MEFYLYYPKASANHKKGALKKVDSSQVLMDMYYELAMLPTPQQLPNKPKSYFEELKNRVSTLDDHVPLFDLRTKNIYLIKRKNVYDRVLYSHYRPITQSILDLLENTLQEINNATSKETSMYFDSFKERLQKNLSFISNFNLNMLQNTFHQVFFNTNPASLAITTTQKAS